MVFLPYLLVYWRTCLTVQSFTNPPPSLSDSPGHYVTFIKSPRGTMPVWLRAVPCCPQARAPALLSL